MSVTRFASSYGPTPADSLLVSYTFSGIILATEKIFEAFACYKDEDIQGELYPLPRMVETMWSYVLLNHIITLHEFFW